MIPSHFVTMSSLSVNVSSKLDRRASRAVLKSLSRDYLGAINRRALDEDRVLSEKEKQPGLVWVEVLGRSKEEIGADGHFTQLRGDSVAAMQVVTACRRGKVISLSETYCRGRVSQLCHPVLKRLIIYLAT